MSHRDFDLHNESKTLHAHITAIACAVITLGNVTEDEVIEMQDLALSVEQVRPYPDERFKYPPIGDKPDLMRLFADAFADASQKLLGFAMRRRREEREDEWEQMSEDMRDVRLAFAGQKGWNSQTRMGWPVALHHVVDQRNSLFRRNWKGDNDGKE